MWVDILVPVVTALIGAGVINFIFKWVADRPKNRAHQNKVWEDFKDDTLEQVKREKAELKAKVDLCEFRLDLHEELSSLLIDDLAALGAPADVMQRRREGIRSIRFVSTLEEAKTIRLQ